MTNPILDKFLKRTSVRSYQTTPLKPEDEQAILNVINTSPTSSNGHAFSAIVIKDLEMKKKIAGTVAHQQQIIQAPLFILFCADWNRIDYVNKQDNLDLITNDFDQFIVGTGDAFIAATMAQDVAIQLNISTCFIGLVRRNLQEIREWLNLSGRMLSLIGMTFGYALEENDLKPKMNRLYFETYDANKIAAEVDQYNSIFAKYYAQRNSNQKTDHNWSSSMAHSYKKSRSQASGSYVKSIWKFDL